MQEAPPSLRTGKQGEKKKFSSHLHNLVHACLQKDPKKRPSASQLLTFKFFQHVKNKTDLQRRAVVRTRLIPGLPNIVERVRQMRAGVDGRSAELVDQAESASMMEYRNTFSQSTWDWHFSGESDDQVRTRPSVAWHAMITSRSIPCPLL